MLILPLLALTQGRYGNLKLFTFVAEVENHRLILGVGDINLESVPTVVRFMLETIASAFHSNAWGFYIYDEQYKKVREALAHKFEIIIHKPLNSPLGDKVPMNIGKEYKFNNFIVLDFEYPTNIDHNIYFSIPVPSNTKIVFYIIPGEVKRDEEYEKFPIPKYLMLVKNNAR